MEAGAVHQTVCMHASACDLYVRMYVCTLESACNTTVHCATVCECAYIHTYASAID